MQQLFLNYGMEFMPINHQKHKTPASKVFPTDITKFIMENMPEMRAGLLDGSLTEGMFSIPKLQPVYDAPKPENLIPFNAVMSLSGKHDTDFSYFHFFVHDYQFERMWRNPQVYIPFLQQIKYGIAPDFSMYLNMHPAEALINCVRNRLVSLYIQNQGITLIPNVCSGSPETLSWALDGLPEDNILAINTQGCFSDAITMQSLINTLHAVSRRKHPRLPYVYGIFPDAWRNKFNMNIVTLPTFCSKWRAL